MLETIKDENDKVISYCDWKLIRADGNLDDRGDYVWIDDFFCHYSCDIRFAISEFTKKITKRAPWIKYVYFQRYEKYGNDSWKLYNVERFSRRIKSGRNQDTNNASSHDCRSVSVAVG